MKKYTVKSNEDLGSIARKFWLPSWKYLYELNKDVIGDNPDLLKEGTKLEIPQWDSTTGDEKIKEKDAEPFEYCNGLRYAYPWVPFSLSLVDSSEIPIQAFDSERDVVVTIRKTGTELYKGRIKNVKDIRRLLPHSSDINIGIKGFPFNIGPVKHIHPDDMNSGQSEAASSERKDCKTEAKDSDKETILKQLGIV